MQAGSARVVSKVVSRRQQGSFVCSMSTIKTKLAVWGYAALWGFVLLQMWIPASYYFASNLFDQRFAWRMFSLGNGIRCDVKAYDMDSRGERTEIALRETLPSHWVLFLQRRQASTPERYLERRCSMAVAPKAELQYSCRDARGASLGEERLLFNCATKSFEK